jgi:hypothetical protein
LERLFASLNDRQKLSFKDIADIGEALLLSERTSQLSAKRFQAVTPGLGWATSIKSGCL